MPERGPNGDVFHIETAEFPKAMERGAEELEIEEAP